MKRLWTFYPMRPHHFGTIALVLVVVSAFVSYCWAQGFVQQGPKLVGLNAAGGASQGWSVALSADGNTAIVAGPYDNAFSRYNLGAEWVFTRSGGVWSQQGPKLIGMEEAVGGAALGRSVALSADGNTAIVGGPQDTSYYGFGVGAAWVFTRVGGVWSQQGSKLVGTGVVGLAGQGQSVALSADGNTAIVGGPCDNNGTVYCDPAVGAAWVFTRVGEVWSQQGSKLVGTGAVGLAHQGSSVALSADGNTAIVGGYGDKFNRSNRGAAWVFTRVGEVWSQQGSKLVGTGAVGPLGARQGSSVALSADGNTALVAGPMDNNGVGAAWVFTRVGGVWSQQGSKLVGTGAVGTSHQGGWPGVWGGAVALSADGNKAIVGGPYDNGGIGAAWVFTRVGGVWSQQGSKLVGTGFVDNYVHEGSSVALSADGNTAIVGGPDDNYVGAAWVFTTPFLRVKLNVTTTPVPVWRVAT